VPGYEVGGKTGTADKPRPTGGYYDDKVIATFAGLFPASDPRYVIVVSLDEPVETSGAEPRRTAGLDGGAHRGRADPAGGPPSGDPAGG
jgi:cell division protein FtsI (penicillin-binding protein 3)